MNHQEIQEILASESVDLLDNETKGLVETHLASCVECREFAETADLLGSSQWFANHIPVKPLAGEERRALKAALLAELPKKKGRKARFGVGNRLATGVLGVALVALLLTFGLSLGRTPQFGGSTSDLASAGGTCSVMVEEVAGWKTHTDFSTQISFDYPEAWGLERVLEEDEILFVLTPDVSEDTPVHTIRFFPFKENLFEAWDNEPPARVFKAIPDDVDAPNVAVFDQNGNTAGTANWTTDEGKVAELGVVVFMEEGWNVVISAEGENASQLSQIEPIMESFGRTEMDCRPFTDADIAYMPNLGANGFYDGWESGISFNYPDELNLGVYDSRDTDAVTITVYSSHTGTNRTGYNLRIYDKIDAPYPDFPELGDKLRQSLNEKELESATFDQAELPFGGTYEYVAFTFDGSKFRIKDTDALRAMAIVPFENGESVFVEVMAGGDGKDSAEILTDISFMLSTMKPASFDGWEVYADSSGETFNIETRDYGGDYQSEPILSNVDIAYPQFVYPEGWEPGTDAETHESVIVGDKGETVTILPNADLWNQVPEQSFVEFLSELLTSGFQSTSTIDESEMMEGWGKAYLRAEGVSDFTLVESYQLTGGVAVTIYESDGVHTYFGKVSQHSGNSADGPSGWWTDGMIGVVDVADSAEFADTFSKILRSLRPADQPPLFGETNTTMTQQTLTDGTGLAVSIPAGMYLHEEMKSAHITQYPDFDQPSEWQIDIMHNLNRGSLSPDPLEAVQMKIMLSSLSHTEITAPTLLPDRPDIAYSVSQVGDDANQILLEAAVKNPDPNAPIPTIEIIGATPKDKLAEFEPIFLDVLRSLLLPPLISCIDILDKIRHDICIHTTSEIVFSFDE